jgi:hypothetical protein
LACAGQRLVRINLKFAGKKEKTPDIKSGVGEKISV